MWIRWWTWYHYSIGVVTFVPAKFLSAAETGRTDVQAVAQLADGIGAFYSDGVGEIATTAVAFDLKTGFGHGCGCCRSGEQKGGGGEGEYSGFLPVAEAVSFCG